MPALSPATEARQTRCRNTYMPTKLKTMMVDRGLSLTELCASVLQMNGNPISKTAMCRIYVHDEWPTKTPAESIKKQAIAWLKTQGVPDDEADAAFEIDTDEQARGKPKLGRPTLTESKPAKETPYDPFAELVEPCMLTQQARKHFRLFSDPFARDPANHTEVFKGRESTFAAEALMEAVRNNRLFALVGESGSGKTTVMDEFFDRIRREQLDIRVIMPRIVDKSKITGGSILEAIVRDLDPDVTLRATNEGRMRQAHALLADRMEEGGHTVILFEEGHDIPVPALKLLKRFHEIKVGFRRTLAIVLFAQPELKVRLSGAGSQAREVANRLEIVDMMPLDDELPGYIAKRMESINARADDIFTTDAFDAIRAKLTVPSRHDRSQMVSLCYPLMVNNLATRAMNEAAAVGASRVDAGIVRGVTR